MQHQARRKQEHVHDGMFEHHVEEQHDRHPHRDHLAADRGRHHRAHNAGGDHPVAKHAADEQRRHAGRTVRGVAEGPPLADIPDHGTDLVGSLREAERRDEGHHERDCQRAGEIADEDKTPVAQNAAKRDAGALVDPGQRCKHEHAGEEIEAQQIEHAEADREQDRAGQRLARIDVDRDREPRRQRQDSARHVGPDDRVARRHEDLRFARIHHLGDEFRRYEIGHRSSFNVRRIARTDPRRHPPPQSNAETVRGQTSCSSRLEAPAH